MEFRKYLEQTSEKLEKEVQEILNQWLKEVEKTDRKLIPLAKAFIKANFGGKGIRGTLVKLGYEIARHHLRGGGKVQSSEHLGGEVLKIGAAYEIFHTAILAHDDIMDKSPTRRGKPALYKNVGVPQAITLGDLGFFLAIKIISESKFEDKKKNQALDLFSKTMIDTTMGQMLDIAHADPKLVARLKTAQYTIICPLQLGAILAGTNEKLLANLGDFGHHLGIAHQIRDDILDEEALEYAGQMGVEYVTQAKKYIPKITADESIRTLLEDMAEYLINRDN